MTGEAWIRLAAFAAVLAAMSVWEAASPRRPRRAWRRRDRWAGNLLMVGFGAGLTRLLLPLVAVAAGRWAQQNDAGLWNRLGHPLNAWAEMALSIATLDLAIFVQHVLMHRLPLLWRIHRVHHADMDLDATTGVRFHPLELLLSAGWRVAVVLSMGIDPLSVLVFEIALNAAAMFNHANVDIPRRVDRWLRLALVTPDFHRVHHSTIPRETNSNFGFTVPWWDFALGTYRPQPEQGHLEMPLGLSRPRGRRWQRTLWMTLMPLLPWRVLREGEKDRPAGNASHPGGPTQDRSPD